MASENDGIPLGWGEHRVRLHSYVSFYYSTPEAMRRSLAFLRVGLDEPGTFCVLLAEDARLEEHLRSLQDGYDGDVGQRVRDRKLVAAAWQANFDGLVDTLMGRIDEALAEGHVRIRAMGLVSWSQEGWGDRAWLKRCERAINMAASMYPMVILCTYNIPQLPGELAREMDGSEQPRVVINEAMGTLKMAAARMAVSFSRRVPGLL